MIKIKLRANFSLAFFSFAPCSLPNWYLWASLSVNTILFNSPIGSFLSLLDKLEKSGAKNKEPA